MIPRRQYRSWNVSLPPICSGLQTVRRGLANKRVFGLTMIANMTALGPTILANGLTIMANGLQTGARAHKHGKQGKYLTINVLYIIDVACSAAVLMPHLRNGGLDLRQ